jgi:hypothetical protein
VAAATDLGSDRKFTGNGRKGGGWKGPDALDIAVRIHKDGRGLTAHRTRGSAGPWRVATDGRNQGNASGFAGPGLNHRTGITSRTSTGKVRLRRTRARRWNGRTEGKGTWHKSAAAIGHVAGPAFEKMTRQAIVDAFTHGG